MLTNLLHVSHSWAETVHIYLFIFISTGRCCDSLFFNLTDCPSDQVNQWRLSVGARWHGTSPWFCSRWCPYGKPPSWAPTTVTRPYRACAGPTTQWPETTSRPSVTLKCARARRRPATCRTLTGPPQISIRKFRSKPSGPTAAP